jgi:hypothetical protein
VAQFSLLNMSEEGSSEKVFLNFDSSWEKARSAQFVEIVYVTCNLIFFLVPPVISKSSLAFPAEELIGWSDAVDWCSPFVFTATLGTLFFRMNVSLTKQPYLIYAFIFFLVMFIQGTSFHLAANSISNRFKYDNATHVVYNYGQDDEVTIAKVESSVFKCTDFYDSFIGHEWLQLGFMTVHVLIVYAGQTYGTVKPPDEDGGGRFFSPLTMLFIFLQCIFYTLDTLQSQTFILYVCMFVAIVAIVGTKKNYRQHESMFITACVICGGLMTLIAGAATGFGKIMK